MTYTCLSIKQPYASLIAKGEKKVELRTWVPSGKYVNIEFLVVSSKKPEKIFPMKAIDGRLYIPPNGVCVCLAKIRGVLRFDDIRELVDRELFSEFECRKIRQGNWVMEGAKKMHAWELEVLKEVNPVAIRGMLGFYKREALIESVRDHLLFGAAVA